MLGYWNVWKDTDVFIYLHEKHDFRLSPPRTNVQEFDFVDRISRAAEKLSDIRRLFGAYAYISDAIQRATDEEPYIAVPTELPRTTVSVAPFSEIERQTIAQYEDHHLDMWQ
jgi:hypothetical protein